MNIAQHEQQREHMSILHFLRLANTSSTEEHPTSQREDNSILQITRELDSLPDDRALYLAIFAYVLGRAAHADSHFSEAETQKMKDIVQLLGDISNAQAELVVEIVKCQVLLFGGTDNYIITRQFREISTPEQRRQLLECVFAISSADKSITVAEESQARQISKELGLTHKEFANARSGYIDHLAALKSLRANHSNHVA